MAYFLGLCVLIGLSNDVFGLSAVSLTEKGVGSKNIEVQDLETSNFPLYSIECEDEFNEDTQSGFKKKCETGCIYFMSMYHRSPNRNLDDISKECTAKCLENFGPPTEIAADACAIGCFRMFARAKDGTQPVVVYVEQEAKNLLMISTNKKLKDDLLADNKYVKSNVLFRDFDVEYKIPETDIKTMPMEEFAKIAHRNNANVKPKQVSGDWLDCASRNSGIPKWMLLMAVCIAICVAIFLSINSEKKLISAEIEIDEAVQTSVLGPEEDDDRYQDMVEKIASYELQNNVVLVPNETAISVECDLCMEDHPVIVVDDEKV